MILPEGILSQYDAEMRRNPVVASGSRLERIGPIVRVVGTESMILFSDLGTENARAVVAAQAAFFRRTGGEVEWKVFGHDRPDDLESILAEAGFVPEEPETLVAFDLQQGLPGGAVPRDIEFRQVADDAGIQDALTASRAAFGPRSSDGPDHEEEHLRAPNQAVLVAYADGAPVAMGRVDFPPGRSFAGLWGGGTAPEYRHRGVYRGLVAARAALARSNGYRFLTVDARDTSRPILERLGFAKLTTTRPWILRPTSKDPGR